MAEVQSSPAAPGVLPLSSLDTLWFQVTGLLCNLSCSHCLVASSPKNKRMAFLDLEQVRQALGEAEALGVREIYFTGGEPFLHRELLAMLEASLHTAPTTVLTNGVLITRDTADALGDLAASSRYSLEIRVSVDHPDASTNDAVRGVGAHEKALRALRRLEQAGLLPIVTTTEYLLSPQFDSGGSILKDGIYDRFRRVLTDAGIRRPRLKVIPVFHTGNLEGTHEGAPITADMLENIEPSVLQCSVSRVVTAQGIYACPILVGQPEGFLGHGKIQENLTPVTLQHHSCSTCYETGMTCANF